MDCCEFGRITITVDGRVVSARGEWTLKVHTESRAVESNADGSTYTIVTPKPAMASGSLSSCDDVDDLFGVCGATVTFTFPSGKTYTFVDARIAGDPELNTNTGEQSGIEIYSNRVEITRRPT